MSKPVIYTRKSKLVKLQEGLERNVKWNLLTPKQQIASLQKRPGESKKQIARIKEKIEKE